VSAPFEPEIALQRDFYASTAHRYDDEYRSPEEFAPGLNLMVEQLDRWGAQSVLDVGTGTGRLLRDLSARWPTLAIHGIDPVPEMLTVATERFGIPQAALSVGSGERLPFADRSWDAVCEVGMLHHVPRPRAVVAEMLRVADRIVILSDDNRLGSGSLPRRAVKLVLDRLGLLDFAARLRDGRSYRISDNDGVSYNFSVYSVLDLLEEWGDEVIVRSAHGPAPGPLGRRPRYTAPGVVACARRGPIS
jgi:SAM-dependent methyltransferase